MHVHVQREPSAANEQHKETHLRVIFYAAAYTVLYASLATNDLWVAHLETFAYVISEARLGEQNLYVYSLSSSSPLATKRSIFGVTTSGEGPEGETAR